MTASAPISVLDSEIGRHIYFFRGCAVMLDSDLAELFLVSVKRLNEQVRRNSSRFPQNFMFQLTKDECENLRSQIATSSLDDNSMKLNDIFSDEIEEPILRSQIATSRLAHGGRRYAPRVFTEQGVAMVSVVLNSEPAIRVSIQVMETFARVRNERASRNHLSDKMSSLRSEFDQRLKAHTQAILSALSERPNHLSPQFLDLKANNTRCTMNHKSNAAFQEIVSEVASYYDISPEELLKLTRRKAIALPRQVAMYVVRKKTTLSYHEIAAYFKRDHTTVLHACQKIENSVLTKPEFKVAIAPLLTSFGIN